MSPRQVTYNKANEGQKRKSQNTKWFMLLPRPASVFEWDLAYLLKCVAAQGTTIFF